MSDKPEPLPITDPHHILPTFVNQVAGSGQLGGVFNLTLATALWTPVNGEVNPDIVVSCRLRMDFTCLQHLHATCAALIEQNTKPTGATTN